MLWPPQKQHTALLARLEAMRVPELLLGDPVLLAGDAPCELGLVSGLRMRSRAKVRGGLSDQSPSPWFSQLLDSVIWGVPHPSRQDTPLCPPLIPSLAPCRSAGRW